LGQVAAALTEAVRQAVEQIAEGPGAIVSR
jgi:hypothetical protein